MGSFKSKMEHTQCPQCQSTDTIFTTIYSENKTYYPNQSYYNSHKEYKCLECEHFWKTTNRRSDMIDC